MRELERERRESYKQKETETKRKSSCMLHCQHEMIWNTSVGGILLARDGFPPRGRKRINTKSF